MTKPGFSLIEMLVVIAILLLLSAISFMGIQAVREASRRSVCLNQMRQIGLGLQEFEMLNGNFPSTISVDRRYFSLHWQSRVLPFIEQGTLFEELVAEIPSLPSIYVHPQQLFNVPLFQCVSNPDQRLLILDQFDRSFAYTDYCGVGGIDIRDSRLGMFPVSVLKSVSRVRMADVTDGTSNTLCFGERPPNPAGKGYGRWLGSQQTTLATIGVFERYEDFNHEGLFTSCLGGAIGYRRGEPGRPCSALHHWSYHPNGANFSRVDSSVNFVPYAIEPDVLKALATRDGGEASSY